MLVGDHATNPFADQVGLGLAADGRQAAEALGLVISQIDGCLAQTLYGVPPKPGAKPA